MRIAFSSLRPRHRLLASSLVLAGAGIAALLSRHPAWELYLHAFPSSCLLKTFTGVPCLACRGTRATLALAHGNIAMAFRFNPLATVFVAVVAACLIFLGVTGKRPQVQLSRPETILLWTLLVFALLGNWIYVIAQGG